MTALNSVHNRVSTYVAVLVLILVMCVCSIVVPSRFIGQMVLPSLFLSFSPLPPSPRSHTHIHTHTLTHIHTYTLSLSLSLSLARWRAPFSRWSTLDPKL